MKKSRNPSRRSSDRPVSAWQKENEGGMASQRGSSAQNRKQLLQSTPLRVASAWSARHTTRVALLSKQAATPPCNHLQSTPVPLTVDQRPRSQHRSSCRRTATTASLECQTPRPAHPGGQQRPPGRVAARRATPLQTATPKTVFPPLLGRWAEGHPGGTAIGICSALMCGLPSACRRAPPPHTGSKHFLQPVGGAAGRKTETDAGLLKGEEGRT